MRSIAIIGAGSIIFCKTLLLDILATPGLEDTHFRLMAPSLGKQSQVKALADRVIARCKLPARVTCHTSMAEALDGADYVIATYQVGGVDVYQTDIEIPLRYGVDQCIGDTMGPGGIFRTARTAPVCLEMAALIKRLCPEALVLNYVNPMATVCWMLADACVKSVGLCHGVQTTLDLIAGVVGVDKRKIDYLCAGINHMGWFLEIKTEGRDLYPILRERMERPEFYANEKVRGEVMRHFGYFMTESTGHLSEYLPWFRKNDAALALYCDEPGFGGETGAYLSFAKHTAEKYSGLDMLAREPDTLPPRSVEYGSRIIEAIELNRPFRFNGNLRNSGMIANLPPDCIAEGPVYADALGLHPTLVGELPPQLAALNMTNIGVQRLAVLAATRGDPELLVQAAALDPLTAAKLTLREIRDMVADMLESQRDYLPQFAGKAVRRAPAISIPANTVRADTPIDPALAIHARFGELAKEH